MVGQTDWLGLGITIIILLFIILIVWAKMQGDKVTDVLSQIRDFIKDN